MSAQVALTPHSSSSACGTAAAGLSFAAASPYSFAAARESVPFALSEAGAAADFQSLMEVSSATTPAAERTASTQKAELPAKASKDILATSEFVSSPVKSTLFYNATERAALQQQEQEDGHHRHLGRQLQQLWAGKEEALDKRVETRRTSPRVDFTGSRWRSEERFTDRQNSVLWGAGSLSGGVRGAAVIKEGVGAGRGGVCADGSDCSTRSCATTRALQRKEAADSSSDETRLYRKYSRVGSTYSSSTTSGEDEQYLSQNSCTVIGAQGDKQLRSAEEKVSHSSHTTIAEGCFAAKQEGAAEISDCTHARRSSRSKRRDGKDHRRRRPREKESARKSRQEKPSNSSGESCPQAEVRVAKVRTGTANHISESYYARERKRISSLVRDCDDSSAEEDAVPEDASIVAPGFVTVRCSSRGGVAADIALPPAKPAFCAASAVSAVVVGKAAILGHRGGGIHEAAAIPPAPIPPTTVTGASWGDAFGATNLSMNSLYFANKKCEVLVGEEVAAAIAATPPPLYFDRGHRRGLLFYQKPAGAKKFTAGTVGIETARLRDTAVRHSANEQELRYGSTAGSLALQAGVNILSERGEGGDLCSTDVAGDGTRSVCEKKLGREVGNGEGDVATYRDEGFCRGMSAATAKRGGGFTTASVSTGGATGLRVAASTGALQVGAAASAADRTHRYYQRGDTSDVGRMLSSSSARRGNSSRGGRERLSSTLDRGTGEGAPGKKEGKCLEMPNNGIKAGMTPEPETAAGLRIPCNNIRDAASASGKERELLLPDIRHRSPGAATGGGPGGNSRCGSSSFVGNGAEMAAGCDRGRPGGLVMCLASGGDGGKGGDMKTGTGCVGVPRGNEVRYISRNAVTASMPRTTTVMNKPTRVEAGRQRFLILDAPSDENLPAYIHEMKAFNVTHLVRTCEATYDDALVRESGICTHEWVFPDGEPPPEEVIDEWLTLCNNVASQQRAAAIAVHCVAGLGRAPVLVAVALIEKGMDPMDAIMFIRERRKGAINRRQLQFLKSYRRRSHMQRCCIKGCNIM